MLTLKQKHRLTHPDWPEYLKDISSHWSELMLMECELLHPTTVNTIIKRLDEMEERFRTTFYQQLDG